MKILPRMEKFELNQLDESNRVVIKCACVFITSKMRAQLGCKVIREAREKCVNYLELPQIPGVWRTWRQLQMGPECRADPPWWASSGRHCRLRFRRTRWPDCPPPCRCCNRSGNPPPADLDARREKSDHQFQCRPRNFKMKFFMASKYTKISKIFDSLVVLFIQNLVY